MEEEETKKTMCATWKEIPLVENERLVTKKMTKIHISMTNFGLAIAGG